MIVEHPFGTIKRGWGAYYFLTRRKVSVSAWHKYYFYL
jgi:hypothetical protein